VTAQHDEPPEPPERRGRGRRPAGEVRADILRTVGEILLTQGSAALTYEQAARLAGVSKTTLYKWWPSKGALALDGYFHAVEPALVFPRTGDIRADLTAQMRAFAAVMTRTPAGRVLAELIGQSQTDPDLAAAYRRLYSAERRRLACERLRQAQHDGQIRPEIDPRVLVDQLWGAVYHRILIPDEPVTDDFITALITNLMDGITPRPSLKGAASLLPGPGFGFDQAAEPCEQRVEAHFELVVAADSREDVSVLHEERGGGHVTRLVEQLPVAALTGVGGVKTKVELYRADDEGGQRGRGGGCQRGAQAGADEQAESVFLPRQRVRAKPLRPPQERHEAGMPAQVRTEQARRPGRLACPV
jgi:AcrR family transcriptional regulator